MLSDEEKEAIDYLQLCYDLSTITDESLSKLGIVLNIIEKQSKEIEELKEDLKKKSIFLIKDIYSPKLKEINLQDVEGLIEQGREEVREEIKAKIEVLEKEITEDKKKNDDFWSDYSIYLDAQREGFQSLLEKGVDI